MSALSSCFWPFYLLFVSVAFLIAIADRVPLHLETRFPQVQIDDEFYDYQNGVVEKTLPGPFVYRVLIPYLYKLVTITDKFSLITFDFALKVLLLTACQLAFFQYLRQFFAKLVALAGVLWFDFLISYSLSYIPGPSVIETIDIFNTLVFCIALRFLLQDHLIPLCLLLVVGMLNRETPWILLPTVFLSEWLGRRRFTRVFVVSLALAIPYFGLRFLIETPIPTWFTTHDLMFNIPFMSAEQSLKAIVANIHLLFLLGPLLIISAIRFREHPMFLQLAAAVVPLFLVIHYIFGSIIERRLWMPLYVLLLPLAVHNLSKMCSGEAVPE